MSSTSNQRLCALWLSSAERDQHTLPPSERVGSPNYDLHIFRNKPTVPHAIAAPAPVSPSTQNIANRLEEMVHESDFNYLQPNNSSLYIPQGDTKNYQYTPIWQCQMHSDYYHVRESNYPPDSGALRHLSLDVYDLPRVAIGRPEYASNIYFPAGQTTYPTTTIRDPADDSEGGSTTGAPYIPHLRSTPAAEATEPPLGSFRGAYEQQPHFQPDERQREHQLQEPLSSCQPNSHNPDRGEKISIFERQECAYFSRSAEAWRADASPPVHYGTLNKPRSINLLNEPWPASVPNKAMHLVQTEDVYSLEGQGPHRLGGISAPSPEYPHPNSPTKYPYPDLSPEFPHPNSPKKYPYPDYSPKRPYTNSSRINDLLNPSSSPEHPYPHSSRIEDLLNPEAKDQQNGEREGTSPQWLEDQFKTAYRKYKETTSMNHKPLHFPCDGDNCPYCEHWGRRSG
ncbi:hypothetical protein F5Y19DRAFT_478105 [Xylariaceae sp. FL1651]|nr:hypothetical protein F5Y19DRAFT_478105 [Xylariaceae sp. FL1651]